MSKNQEYAEKYAGYAMEQMRRYGIPASVTLAQGILESSNGQSQLARNENNHFGIKATPSWIDEGGRYALYSDDRPNEKFCSYDSAASRPRRHGLTKADGTPCIRTTVRTKSSAAMTPWATPTSTTPVF